MYDIKFIKHHNKMICSHFQRLRRITQSEHVSMQIKPIFTGCCSLFSLRVSTPIMSIVLAANFHKAFVKFVLSLFWHENFMKTQFSFMIYYIVELLRLNYINLKYNKKKTNFVNYLHFQIH